MNFEHLDTIAVQAGYEPKNGEPRVLPIVQSTTFKYDSAEYLGKLFDLEVDGFFYSRLGNPTVEAVEKKICALEAALAAFSLPAGRRLPSFRSSISAVPATILLALRPFTAAPLTSLTSRCAG